MAITIRKTYAVGGTLTNVVSFTVGVVRADTGATVVAAGTPMTNVSTGTYEYSFTAPATGLTYTYSFVVTPTSGGTLSFTESYADTTGESIPMPALTGDLLLDTINSLIVERLRVSREGPRVSYSLHGHKVDWNQYLKYLDDRIMALRREMAMVSPVEEVGFGF